MLLFSIMLIPLLNSTILALTFNYLNFLLLSFVLIFFILNLKKSRFLLLILIAPAVLFSFLSLVNSFGSLHLGGFSSYIFNLLLLLCFILSKVPICENLFYFLIRLLSLIIIISSSYLYFSNISFMTVGPLTSSGLFLNSNIAGMIYGSILLILLLRPSKINLALTLCLFIILLLSYSRGAILATSLSILIFIFVQSKGYKKIVNSIMIILLLFFLSLGFYFILPESAEGLIKKLSNSGSSGRTEIWSEIIYSLNDIRVLFFGNGPNTFEKNGLSAHNTFLNETHNYGIFFITYLYLLTIVLFIISFAKKYFGLVLIISFSLVLSVFETVMFGGPHFIYVLLLIAYLFEFSKKSIKLC